MARPPAATAMSPPGPVPPPVLGAPDGVPLPCGWPPPLVGVGLLLGCGLACPFATLSVTPTGAGLVLLVQVNTNGTETPFPDTVNLKVNFSGIRIRSIPALVSRSLPEARVTVLVRSVIGSDIAIFPGCAPSTGRSAENLTAVPGGYGPPIPTTSLTVTVLPSVRLPDAVTVIGM